MRTILVPFAPGLASESALDAALSLAKSMNSHIRTIFVRPDPTAALANFPNTLATTITHEAIEGEASRMADEEKVRFERWRSRYAIPAVPTHNRLDSAS